MIDLTTFLGWLPGIKPRVSRTLILNGQLLNKTDRADIHDRDAFFLDTVFVVGPDAAQAILNAYKAGRLPMTRPSVKPSAAPDAEAYVGRADQLRGELATRNRRKRAVADLSLLTLSDLDDYRLLDAIFISQIGLRGGSLTLAGVEVTKSLLQYDSNSGKSSDWQVSFAWQDSEGNRHRIEKASRYASNRRNDAERDWGLPE